MPDHEPHSQRLDLPSSALSSALPSITLAVSATPNTSTSHYVARDLESIGTCTIEGTYDSLSARRVEGCSMSRHVLTE